MNIHYLIFISFSGYEHHLEIDDSEDENIDNMTTDSPTYDSTSYNSNYDKDVKYVKKKSSKKRQDNKQKLLNDGQFKDECIRSKTVALKSDRKITNIHENKGVSAGQSSESHNIYGAVNENLNFASTKPLPSSQNRKVYRNTQSVSKGVPSNMQPYDFENRDDLNNQFPHTSFYRKQMELHEASKKEMEKVLFGDNQLFYNEVYQNETNQIPRVNSKTSSMVPNNLTYHEGHKENLKNYRDIAECDKEIKKCPQNVSHIPHNSNSNINNSTSKSSLLSYRKQSMKKCASSTDQHVQCSTNTDWEKVINDSVYTFNPSNELLTHCDSLKPASYKYRYDYIKSLNMQHTKLPSNVNEKVSPHTQESSSKVPRSNGSEILLKLLKETNMPKCYVSPNKSSRNVSSKAQTYKLPSASNSSKPVVPRNVPISQNLPKSSAENKPPLQCMSSYKTDIYDSFKEITKTSQTFDQMSSHSRSHDVKKECFDSNAHVQLEMHLSKNEPSYSTMDSPKATSTVVQSIDDSLNSNLDIDILQDFNNLLSEANIYHNESGVPVKAVFPNSCFSSIPQDFQQYPQGVIYRNTVSSENCYVAEAKTSHSHSRHPSVKHQKRLVQMKDTHINNTGINKRDNKIRKCETPVTKIKCENTSINQTYKNTRKETVQRNLYSKNENFSVNPPVKNVANLVCSDTGFDLKFHENFSQKNQNNFMGNTVNISTMIKNQMQQCNQTLNDLLALNTAKAIKNEQQQIAYNYDGRIVKKEPQSDKIVCNTSINKPGKISNEIALMKEVEYSRDSDNKKSSLVKNTNITTCAKPIKNSQKHPQSQIIKNTKHSSAEFPVNNLETVEMKDEISHNVEDAFLKDLFNAVNAGLENPNEKLVYKTLADREPDNTDSIYEEFLAELQSSVNAGTSQLPATVSKSSPNSPSFIAKQIPQNSKSFTDKSFATHSRSQTKETIKSLLCPSPLVHSEPIKDVSHMAGTSHSRTKTSMMNTSNQKMSAQNIPNVDIPAIKSAELMFCDKKLAKNDASSKNHPKMCSLLSQKSENLKSLQVNSISGDLLYKDRELISALSAPSKFEHNSNRLDKCFKNNKLTETKKVVDNSTLTKTITENVKSPKSPSKSINDLLSKITCRNDMIVKVGKNSSSTTSSTNSKDSLERSKDPVPQTIIEHSKEYSDKSIKTSNNSNSNIMNPNTANAETLPVSCSTSILKTFFDNSVIQNSHISQQSLCTLTENKDFPSRSETNRILNPISSNDVLPLLKNEDIVESLPSVNTTNSNSSMDENQSNFEAVHSPHNIEKDYLASQNFNNLTLKTEKNKKLKSQLNSSNKAAELSINKQIVNVEPDMLLEENFNTEDRSVLSFKILGNSNKNVLQELKLVSTEECLKESAEQNNFDDSEQIDFESAIALNVIAPKQRNMEETIIKNENSTNDKSELNRTKSDSDDLIRLMDSVPTDTTENVCTDLRKTTMLNQQEIDTKDCANQHDNLSSNKISIIESTTSQNPDNPKSENDEDISSTVNTKCKKGAKILPVSKKPKISLDTKSEDCDPSNNDSNSSECSALTVDEKSSEKQTETIPACKVLSTVDDVKINDEKKYSENSDPLNISDFSLTDSQIDIKRSNSSRSLKGNPNTICKKFPIIKRVIHNNRIVRKVIFAKSSKEKSLVSKKINQTNKEVNKNEEKNQVYKVNQSHKDANSNSEFVTPVLTKKRSPKNIRNDDLVIDITLDDSDDTKSSRVKIDVIEISSDEENENDSSDVEIVSTNDPIAIDTQSFISEQKPNEIVNILSTAVPMFFTHVPNILRKNTTKRKYRKKSNKILKHNQRQSPRINSQSMFIINYDATRMMKIDKIPPADLEKLQLPCAVRMNRIDFPSPSKLPKCSSASPKKKIAKNIRRKISAKVVKIHRKTARNLVKCMNTRNNSKLRHENIELRDSKENLHDKTDDGNILLTEIKKEVDVDSEYSVDKLIDIKLEIKDENLQHDPSDIDKNNSIMDEPNFDHADEKQDSDSLKDKENNCPDVIDNHSMAGFEDQHDKTNRKPTDDLKIEISTDNESLPNDALQPDILYQSNSIITHGHASKTFRRYLNDNACEPSSRSNKIKRTSPVNVIQCSSICPDLLNKTDDKNTYVTMQQPDIVLSNDKKHISLSNLPSLVNGKNFNGSDDDEKMDVPSNSCFKTYQKSHYHKNKRKSDMTTTNSLKKFRTNSKIDLPEVSQDDINLITHDDFSLEVERLLMQGSDSVELFWNDDPIKENLDIDTSGFDLEYKFDFLSKNPSLKIDECSRNSFYSPIFNECETDSAIESYIEKCESHEIIESNEEKTNKHSRQGKGFGVRSDRGNLKDSIRGRPEGPAAVLSDTFTTRPPLALHNFSVKNKNKDCVTLYAEEIAQKGNVNDNKFMSSLGHIEKEMNNNSLCRTPKISKSVLKQFFNRINENGEFESSRDKLYDTKKETNIKSKNSDFSFKYEKQHKISRCDNIFSRVPGLEDLDFMRPLPSTAIVQVVQLGQSPVTSAQQNQLTTLPTVSQTNTNEYADVSTNNSGEYQSLSNEDSRQSNSNEVNASDAKENDNSEEKQEVNDNSNKKSDENTSLSLSCEISDAETNQLQISPTSDPANSSSDIGNLDQIAIDKSNSLNFNEHVPSQSNYTDNIQSEEKDSTTTEPLIENQISNAPSSSANFISTNRGQTLVNLLSQKIIHSPVSGQHVQMTTFPKGTINALSLQQALAQILPPPLSQASNESVIQSANHSSGPQVVHIVQGKSGSQNNNSFSSLLVDNSQSSVMNNPGSAQVLHIVQGKSTPNTSTASILGQSQIGGTTFSGLSLVDSNSQQSGNQVLHIVNAGMQSKNNTAQVLKRVNLLTSITNPQGNNEQKMVQFVCKSSDGKPIQLNAQHQRGMVLRLQPIDNSTFATPKSENQTMNTNISSVQSTIKPQNDQGQELKSRSVYEENYAKFIQNSSQIPSSPEKSTTLPKFNQAFGKSVFQDNAVSKTNDNIDQSQNIAVTVSNEQNSQDISNTLNLSQLGHMNNPPLLIRKNPQSNIVHQNVVQQVKQSIAPMNIQTIHGGVIYTRQIPVNTINLITVPSQDMLDEAQLQQSIQKQNQEKASVGESHLESQVVKIVSQDQPQTNNTICQMESPSEESNSNFTEQNQNNVNTHPLLTQMRIKMPMLSKGNSQMVTGARVVRPVLQIQRNLIPGTNPAVYQQLVLTTAPTLRQPVPTTPTTNVRPSRPSTATPQESNMSTSTLEQLREFDMVLEQVKERSTVQPGSNSNSTFSDTSPQRHVIDNNTELDSSQSNVVHSPAQREVLYSIGPNQTVNVTYVNQKVISKTPTVLTTTYTSSDSNISSISSQNSPSNQITHGLVNTISHSKPCSNTPTKVNSKSIKAKPSKPTNPSSSSASKPNPVAAKTSLQKPLEDEQTTQRILYILAEYKEQVENSPDKDKPAPRRRSNPPTNPTTSSKRKKGSSGNSKKSSSGQSLQEMSPLGGEDAGHTMGSEDSSCGLSQGECTDNSIQGTDNQSPQASPQKAAKKLLFQPDSDMSQSTTQLQPQQQSQPQQRNVIIADGQTIAMTRPGTGKTTAVLMPANYLLPMSMVKGGQQITIVTNQGPKILSVPQGEGNATNTLFLQRLISPTGLKPMLTRPGQVRHVRLPANTVQNLQAFNLSPNTNVSSQDSSWISNNSLNTNQPKLVVEYNPSLTNNSDLNPDSVKSEISDSPSLKDDNVSLNNENVSCIKHEDSVETNESRLDENISIDQSQSSIQESNIPNLSDHVLQQVHVSKSSTLNLIQVHSLNSQECGKLFTVQSSSGLNSLIQIPNKSLNQSLHNLNTENEGISTIVSESSQNMLRKQSLENQFLNTTKTEDGDSDIKLPDINQLDENLSISDDLSNNGQQSFVLSHSNQHSNDPLNKCHGNRETHTPWR